MSAPYGYISVTDPILTTSAIIGDIPTNATQNADAWHEAAQYAYTNNLKGIYLPGVMSTDAVLMLDGSKSVSVKGLGRLKSGFKKYGTAVSSVSENDPARAVNTRLGFNVTYPNAVMHVYNQMNDAALEGFALVTDVIETAGFGLASPSVLSSSASTDIPLVVSGMAHSRLDGLYLAGGKKAGFVEPNPSFVCDVRNVRINYCANGAGIWSHNQSTFDQVYVSHFRSIGISVQLDSCAMSCCPVELGGSSLGGHSQGDLTIAYAMSGSRDSSIRACSAEYINGCLLELSGCKGLTVQMRSLEHFSDYVGPLSYIYAAYGANNTDTTLGLSVEYAAAALTGGASLAKHHDFGGTGNTNTTNIRAKYSGGWGNKNIGFL